MIIRDELWFSFDCMPSEQGGLSADDYITYCGIAILNWDSKFDCWKQYKHCSKSDRKSQSEAICNALQREDLIVIPLLAFCKVDVARHNGAQLSKELFGIPEFISDKRYEFFVEGYRVDKNRALMYANYAAILSLLSWRGGQFAELYGFNKLKFTLDLLPGDHRSDGHHPGFETIKAFLDGSPLLGSMWADAKATHSLEEIGCYYVGEGNTPGDILADWFAQSFHASLNHKTFRQNLRRNSESRRREIANIAFAWHKSLVDRGMENYCSPIIMPKISNFSGVVNGQQGTDHPL